MRTIKFCSAVFGVTSSLPVINNIHWRVALRRVVPLLRSANGAAYCYTNDNCNQLTTYGPAALCLQRVTVEPLTTSDEERYWSKISDFFIPHPRSMSPLGGPRQNVAIRFGVEILERCVYRAVKKCVCSFRQNTQTWRTNGRTDRQTSGRTPYDGLCIASRGKNCLYQWRLTPSRCGSSTDYQGTVDTEGWVGREGCPSPQKNFEVFFISIWLILVYSGMTRIMFSIYLPLHEIAGCDKMTVVSCYVVSRHNFTNKKLSCRRETARASCHWIFG